jgi:hypothetical protein
MGDFSVDSIAATLEPYLPQIAKAIQEHASARKTVVFCPLISIAQELAGMIPGAKEVNGTSPDRKETLEWFDKAGLKITPQGDFTLTAQMIFYSDNSVQDIEIPCNIEITETTEGAPEGYKYVFGVFTVDYSEYDDLYENWDFVSWFSAFDRYTGTSFESDPSATYGDSQTPGVIPIEYDGKTYDITYLFGYTKKSGVATISVTVTCPEDYEGTVFQCGSGPWEVVDEYSQMDLSEKLYTIDELPYYDSNGYPYFYFSNTNK